jgi:hypothetical protein
MRIWNPKNGNGTVKSIMQHKLVKRPYIMQPGFQSMHPQQSNALVPPYPYGGQNPFGSQQQQPNAGQFASNFASKGPAQSAPAPAPNAAFQSQQNVERYREYLSVD